MELLRLYVSELKKIKKTLALLLAVSAPLLVVIFMVLMVTNYETRGVDPKMWESFINQICLFWTALMAPLYISIELGLLSELEFANNNWKLVLSQPISKANAYLAKMMTAVSLILFSNVILFLGTIMAGSILGIVRPDLGFAQSNLDLSGFSTVIALSFLASFLIIAIHTWLSVRFRSFVISVVIAVFAVVGNVMAVGSDQFQKFFPWIFSFDIVKILKLSEGATGDGITVGYVLLFSIIGAICVTLLGAIDISRRDVP
jgi:hypothetical protein